MAAPRKKIKSSTKHARFWILPRLVIHATCVRVPVRVAHCESVHAQFSGNLTVEDAIHALKNAPGIQYIDERAGRAAEPITAAGTDWTYVSRVRQNPDRPNTLDFWVVADNLRKGAATNAVQCAKELIRRGLVG